MPIIETIETEYILESGVPLRIQFMLNEVRCCDCGDEFLSLEKNETNNKQRCGLCNDKHALGEFWVPYTESS